MRMRTIVSWFFVGGIKTLSLLRVLWMGEEFDPNEFDLGVINKRLKALARRSR